MNLGRRLFLFATLLIGTLTHAQQPSTIWLKTGPLTPMPNISEATVDSFNTKATRYYQKAYALLQFRAIPTEADRKYLRATGIELLDYLPDNTYTATFSGPLSLSILRQTGATALLSLSPQHKMDPLLAKGAYPAWAITAPGTIDVRLSFPKTFAYTQVMGLLREKDYTLLSEELARYRILDLRLPVSRLYELAGYPFVEYVQPKPPGVEPLNQSSRNGSRATVLNTSLANGGKGLNGEGLVIGIGDNSDIQFHADFSGRLINRHGGTQNSHGNHVAATMAGAGIINELHRGYAPRATMVNQNTSAIVAYAPDYVADHGMVLTNNSYGAVLGCGSNGLYELTSQFLDQQAFDMPSLLQVFSAGNSGADHCAPFPPSFRTVLGYFQSAKNVLTVGNTTDSGQIITASSKGPVRDGRVKPEIVAMGTSVISAGTNNNYFANTGTSMSAPAVTGGLALLYQRYRQLHGGSNPKSGLMKAIVCNGAADRGNAGPDFSYGFGWMNLLRSMDILEHQWYMEGSSTHGATNAHTITVPANTAKLKVMLYWHDPPGAAASSKALVNDLDLEVAGGTLASYLPQVLDTSAAGVTTPAVAGADHTNNMEQIVIDNPAPGNYTAQVKGTLIAQNPSQDYFLVYDLVPVSLKLTHPVGGEGVLPGETIKITWDAFGDTTKPLALQYSPDNGVTWTDIATGLNANRTLYSWKAPTAPTSAALIRLSKDNGALVSTSKPFSIVGAPALSLAAVQCEGYIALNWTAVPGATDYEVMRLQGGEMVPVATTTATSYTFSGLSADSTYWVSVRARLNGQPGRRANALSRLPASGTCAGALSDNDLKLQALSAPRSGRQFTSTALSGAEAITVQVKNLDDAPVSGFQVQYAVNGGPYVTEPVAATIAPGATYTHTFAATADLSALGNYTLVAVVKNNAADPVAANDTVAAVARHLANEPISLATPFLDDLEGAVATSYGGDTIGLPGIERYDFENTHPFGRLRTFLNSGIAFSGSRAFTLDRDRSGATPKAVNYVTGTYNLGGYTAASDDIRLDFQFNSHGTNSATDNKVWIRGADTLPWIEVYDLYASKPPAAGSYKRSSSLELADSLRKHGQEFSASFQVRWSQSGTAPAVVKTAGAGSTIDDIRLYQAIHDLALVRIDTPGTLNCGLSTGVPITVTVRNSHNGALTNVPVKYAINDGAWVTETIPSIGANTTLPYTFARGADFSVSGVYSLKVAVSYPTDNLRYNDSARLTLQSAPLVNTFPYLQNFEGGNGGFYAEGTNASWALGTPASPRINRAASGTKAWKTNLGGNYGDMELSYLYTPCFDISGLDKPALSFSLALDLENCGTTVCDAAWVEYSTDSKNWVRLKGQGGGTNWYNQGDTWWTVGDYTRWHVATAPLPDTLGFVRFRFVFQSDPAVTKEGVAIDDFHIYDNVHGIYDGPTLPDAVTQNAAGNDWVHFTSGGKLVASLQPQGQALGATAVRAYMEPGAVRHNNAQYYHPRSLTIKPEAKNPADSVRVRFYFLDGEAEQLLAATGCAVCQKPGSAYELGVSKYSDVQAEHENGTIDDNQQGLWQYLASEKVAVVPFDKGYYAEFGVKDFSEFWLNAGGLDRNTPLPVKLMDFRARKQGNDVALEWETDSESGVARYELELARGDKDVQAGHFEKIGQVESRGDNSSVQLYSFTDGEGDKWGTRYYRLKVVNADGTFQYSLIRPVVFADPVTWKIYPNPSAGVFNLVFHVNNGEQLEASLYDAQGRLLEQYRKQGTGYPQKLTIDLSGRPYASGIYMLHTVINGRKEFFKLYKQ